MEFYDALLAIIGIEKLWQFGEMAVWGPSRTETAFCLARPFDGYKASVGNGAMVAFKVKNAEQVDAFHAKAIELGAKNEGDPGLRGEHGVYAGYFRDLDGNKLNAYVPAPGDVPMRKLDLKNPPEIEFVRLTHVSLGSIVSHMNDRRVAEHMPLLRSTWTYENAKEFVSTKEGTWRCDGLGHWAILSDGAYVGWGGFQKEGEDWDFGLVLKPDNFGLGMRISRKAIEFAYADPRIDFVTFLLPPSRKNLGALSRIGAKFVENVEYDGEVFKRYRLETM